MHRPGGRTWIKTTVTKPSCIPKGPITPGGLTERYLADYPNMFGDLSAGSGLNALTRDETFTTGFFQRHQDKLMYGSDCNDHEGAVRNVRARKPSPSCAASPRTTRLSANCSMETRNGCLASDRRFLAEIDGRNCRLTGGVGKPILRALFRASGQPPAVSPGKEVSWIDRD